MEHEGKKALLGLLASLLLLSVVQSIITSTWAYEICFQEKQEKFVTTRRLLEDKASKFNNAMVRKLSSRGIHFVCSKDLN